MRDTYTNILKNLISGSGGASIIWMMGCRSNDWQSCYPWFISPSVWYFCDVLSGMNCLLQLEINKQGAWSDVNQKKDSAKDKGSSESNASDFMTLAHNIRGECWRDGSRGGTFLPLSHDIFLPWDRCSRGAVWQTDIWSGRWLCWKIMFCSWEYALSDSVTVLFVSVLICMERHYSKSDLRKFRERKMKP